MPFEDYEAGTGLDMGQAAIAPQPDPVAATVGQPALGAEGQRAVVGVFDGELEENLVRGPFVIPAAEDVGFLAGKGGPDLQIG